MVSPSLVLFVALFLPNKTRQNPIALPHLPSNVLGLSWFSDLHSYGFLLIFHLWPAWTEGSFIWNAETSINIPWRCPWDATQPLCEPLRPGPGVWEDGIKHKPPLGRVWCVSAALSHVSVSPVSSQTPVIRIPISHLFKIISMYF